MAFVKVETGILNSSLWVERDQRSVFLTALFMAEPYELVAPTPQLHVDRIEETGWVVPAGWYGLVRAAGSGIIRKDGVSDAKAGYAMLAALGSPDPDSRSSEYEGRRLVRINGGYLVLNFFKYRDRDHGAAERMRRMRDRKKKLRESQPYLDRSLEDQASTNGDGVTRNVTPVRPNVTHSRGRGRGRGSKKLTSEPSPFRLAPFIDLWDAFHAKGAGTSIAGKFGKAVKPLVARHGESAVLDQLRLYLREVGPKFRNPQGFAQGYGAWTGKSGKLGVAETRKTTLARFVQEHK